MLKYLKKKISAKMSSRQITKTETFTLNHKIRFQSNSAQQHLCWHIFVMRFSFGNNKVVIITT